MPVDEEFLVKVAEYALKQEEAQANAELSIALVDEEEIRELNARYRGKDYPTDVLSFQSETPEHEVPVNVPYLLGDVVICPAVATRQAKEYGQTFDQEMGLLLTHGILHLLGYDHEAEPEAEEMEAREREILSAFFGKETAEGLTGREIED